MSMMGGTALLDELLAEQAAGCSAASHDTGIREEAVVTPPMLPVGRHRGDPTAPCVTPASNAAETRQDDLLVAPGSPLSRQIEELAREMDDCLGSLGDQWEEEKRQHRQNLINKLEAQYGAENDFDATGESFYGSSCYMPRHGAIDSDKPDLISPFPEVASAEVSLEATDEVLARLRDEDEVERCTDQARISSLRAEVEELRIKAAGGSVSFAPLNAVPLSIVDRPAYVVPALHTRVLFLMPLSLGSTQPLVSRLGAMRSTKSSASMTCVLKMNSGVAALMATPIPRVFLGWKATSQASARRCALWRALLHRPAIV